MNLAWIDLETTGTDETSGSILEIGLQVTDTELRPLDRFETLVVPDIAHVADMTETVREMHTASGLLDELDALNAERAGGRPHDGLLPLDVADVTLARYLSRWTVRGQIVLAGSGVGHFDARWIRRHLPKTASLLTYWPIDVGVVRRYLTMIAGIPTSPPLLSAKTHRAAADVADHLDEARRYRDALNAASSIIATELARPRPGDRTVNGGELGTLVRCPECSGDGLLHRPDTLPRPATPDGP